jgi:hypothetical protein
MRRHIGNKFMELSASDRVSLSTIRVSDRKDIFRVVDDLDRLHFGCTLIYFPYEVLDTRRIAALDMGRKQDFYYYEVVSVHYTNALSLQALFESSPKCAFVRTEALTVLELYQHLSKTSFRVYNKLVFRRLALERAKEIGGARNLLARMHFYQDVFCLSNLDEEGRFLSLVQQNPNRTARLYGSTNTGDGD